MKPLACLLPFLLLSQGCALFQQQKVIITNFDIGEPRSHVDVDVSQLPKDWNVTVEHSKGDFGWPVTTVNLSQRSVRVLLIPSTQP